MVLAVINGSDDGGADDEPTTTTKPDLAAARDAASTPAATPADPVQQSPLSQVEESGKRLRLSPVVRRLIAEHQLDAYQIQGSGRDGRITRNDVIAFAAVQKPVPAASPTATAARPPAPVQAPATQYADGERVPFDRIRRLTAEHMVRSKATSPHVLQAVEVDFSAVDQVRLALREQWRREQGFSLTYLPFIARATCMAIRDFPRINASVDGEGLIIHGPVHLSFAVALGLEGLVAPVIRDAGDLTVSGLARRISEISSRARDNALGPDDLTGGTYTLSNNGSFGTLMTAAVINQPQIAILSVDAIKKQPVVI